MHGLGAHLADTAVLMMLDIQLTVPQPEQFVAGQPGLTEMGWTVWEGAAQLAGHSIEQIWAALACSGLVHRQVQVRVLGVAHLDQSGLPRLRHHC